MGLSQSLFSGISGLTTHQKAMDNIGNNLANVNTVAFKKGVFQFRTMLEQTLKGGTTADPNTGRGSINPLQMGLGTQTGSILKDFSEGSVEITGNQRDMALAGNGFFVLRNGNNNVFTRDGTFYIGSDGSLLYGDGLQVQGVMAEEAGEIPEAGEVSDITIPIGQTGAAIETTKASFTGNLNSNVSVAEGLKLAANAAAINSNEALKKYLGTVKDAASGSGVDDSTWNALTGNSFINGGTTWTSSAFGVMNPSTGAIEQATLTGDSSTALEDLWYLSGNTWTQPFKNIDNPARFTALGDSAAQLTNWDFSGPGFKQEEKFYYHLESDGNTPEGFILEIYDTPYADVVANVSSGGSWTAAQGYASLLATTAVGTVSGSTAPWTLHDYAIAEGKGSAGLSDTAGSYYTPEGSDMVTFQTTDSGRIFAQANDPTMTSAVARTAFGGSVRFGNDLVSGDGELTSYTPANVDQAIEISYRKGGRKYDASFTYDAENGAQSSTIEHLMKFLTGSVDSTVNAGSIEAIQTPLATPPVGGAMGTIQTGGRVSSSIDGGEYGYNVPVETAGAFTRNGITNTVPYAGYFTASGDDASSLENWTMTESGFAIKSKWYYEVEAFELGSTGVYEYAVNAYSDSARTNPVSTTNSMMGTGDLEMRRTCQINGDTIASDLASTGSTVDEVYDYQVTGPDTSGNYNLQVFDRDLGVAIAETGFSSEGSVGLTLNTTAAYPGTSGSIGSVSFGSGMIGGSSGYLYMKNMDVYTDPDNPYRDDAHGPQLAGAGFTSLSTTIQGQSYSQNNGIGSFSALSSFDGNVELGNYFTATETSYSYGSLDTSGPSQNYSILSNLGAENAITDIVMGYNNVSYTDMWTQDTKYSEEQGGSTTTNIIVYDSLGNPKEINMTMSLIERDSDFSTYRWIAESQDDTDAQWYIDEASMEIKTNVNVGTGTIRFDSEGNFVRGAELSETQGIDLTLKGQGVSDQLRINLLEGLSPEATQDLDFSFLTQVASSSDFNLREQDGSPPGTLDTFTTSPDGIIQGVYSNGVVQAIARMSIALVPNMNGMMSAGDNLFYTAPASGGAQISFANVGGRGQIRSGAVESSNVDMSQEFTKLITTQRGFQANARIISTSDEMLQELVNLKR